MTTTDDIIKYVQHTPENTNPSVLKDLLNNLEEGKSIQPDWNQNDETAADYIKNRPFYDNPSTSVSIPSSPGRAWYKVSDAVPTGDHSVNASCIAALSIGGKNEVKEAIVELSVDDWYVAADAAVIVALKDNVTMTEFGLTLPEKGTYFLSAGADTFISGFALGSDVDLEITWDGSTGEIKKLNEKFLPDPLILYGYIDKVYKNDDANNPEYATTEEIQQAFFGREIFIKTSDGIYEKVITFNPTISTLETKSNSYVFHLS